jgi:hypothetical protein
MPVTCAIVEVRKTEGGLSEALFIPSDAPSISNIFVIFPGDISDFPCAKNNDALAMGCEECMNYNYSLDSLTRDVSSIVGSRCATVCFRPCSFRGNFACYSNYVPTDFFGNPQWEKTSNDPCLTLLEYLDSLAETLFAPELRSARLVLVGFSKGAVVLSALLRSRNPKLLERVDKFVFVDPGLSTPGRLFPFTQAEYDSFPSEIPMKVYTTDYQMCDPGRPWLRREILEFAGRSGARLTHVPSGSKRSLDIHFNSITVAIATTFRDSY